MKINKINVSIQKTVQMRQFEPAQVFISTEVQIDPGDSMKKVFEDTKTMIRAEVNKEVDILKKERKDSYDNEMEKSV